MPTPALRIAVLDMYDNVPNEGMRCIKQQLATFLAKENLDAQIRVFNVRAHQELPDLDFDIYLSSGGPGSPLPENAAWETPYFQLIDRLFEHNRNASRKKYLFLICHSFQLVVGHLKLASVAKRKSTSFGVHPIHRSGNGFSEQVFYGLPEPFFAVDSRDYQVVQPNAERLHLLGAHIVATEKIRPHVPLERAIMAIRFSPEIFGTQFHPEADAEGMLHHFITEEKRALVIQQYGNRKYYEMIQRLDDPEKIMLTESTIIPRFLETAVHHILPFQHA